MSYENLMSHLGFSTNLQDYTTSIAFKDNSDASYSSRTEDDKKFNDFMDSLKESNDSKGFSQTSSKSKAADEKEVPASSSADVKEKQAADKPLDTDVVTKETETPAETGSVKVKEEPQEVAITEVATDEAAPISTNSEGQTQVAEASPIIVQAVAVNPDQSIEITLANALGLEDSAEVITIAPEEMSSALAGLSEKLAALINQAISSLSDEAGSGEEVIAGKGITDFGVSMVQGSADDGAQASQTGGLLELLSALLGQIDSAEISTQMGTSDNPALQAVVTQLQNGEEIDLAPVLSSLKPEQVRELTDQISAYLTGELSAQEQKELIGLLAQHYPAALPITPQVTTEAPVVVAQVASTEAAPDAPKTSGVPQQANTAPEANNAARAEAPVQDAVASNAQTKAAPEAVSGEKTATAAAPIDSEAEAVISTMSNVKSDDTIKTKAQSDGPVKQDAPVSAGTGERFLQANNNAGSVVAIEGDAALSQSALGISSALQAQSSAVGSLSSASGQAMNAGSAHPATQAVSITMQKAIKAGEETTIKLKLDPPELGRVEVKMSIDQDSTTKIVLTVEKADTHALLQRDAQLLERAMSDAGLETQGNLSFELAEDGQAFEKGDSANDQANAGDRDSGDEVENAIITQSSTMDWYIDPNTGRTHYSILT